MNETALRDLQQDIQRNGTRLDRGERRLSEIDGRLDGMDQRFDSLQAGLDRIEAIVTRLLTGNEKALARKIRFAERGKLAGFDEVLLGV